jgi:hypothetical protein
LAFVLHVDFPDLKSAGAVLPWTAAGANSIVGGNADASLASAAR